MQAIDVEDGCSSLWPDKDLDTKANNHVPAASQCIWDSAVWARDCSHVACWSILVLDAFRGHCADVVKTRLVDKGTDFVIVPGGMTSVFQPLDVCLNKPLKATVRSVAGWPSLCPHTDGRHSKVRHCIAMPGGYRCMEILLADMVRKSFRKCAISNTQDGSGDHNIFESSDKASGDSSSSGNCTTELGL